MVERMHLVIPMSGQGTRYARAGYDQPKPLIPVSGIPMVERLLASFPRHWLTHFVLAENHRETELPALLAALRPEATVTYIAPHKQGPSYAVLSALPHVPDDEPVFVSYCDYGKVWDSYAFERFVRTTECDACLTSYRGFHAHYVSPTLYAYSRLEGERVVEVREKGHFTPDREQEYASAGGYYFRTAALLHQAITAQMARNLEIGGEYYTSLTVEALLQENPRAHVRVFELPGFFQWGTPEDLQGFEFWERSFAAQNRNAGHTGRTSQVLMPMAGLGSRFAGITLLPKPLIPVSGQPMFAAALATLPRAERVAIVTLENIATHLRQDMWPTPLDVVTLSATPSGQALSTDAGAGVLDQDRDVIVTACDHGIVLSAARWAEFRSAPACDAAIFTMQGYPGAARRPLAYSYVAPDSSEDAFPLVQRVSVKQPTSDNPLREHVLVGTFWFASVRLMRAGIAELERIDRRVNGELYLDSVFTCLQAMGYRVRMIPLEGFICWGEPDTLAEALYWQEIFGGRRLDRRPRFPGVLPHG